MLAPRRVNSLICVVHFRVKLFPNFLDKAESQEMFEALFHQLPWRQRSYFVGGIKYAQPRMTQWFGPLPYSYSGLTHEANESVSVWHHLNHSHAWLGTFIQNHINYKITVHSFSLSSSSFSNVCRATLAPLPVAKKPLCPIRICDNCG